MPGNITHAAPYLLTTLLIGQAALYYGMSHKEVIPDLARWSTLPAQIGPWILAEDVELEDEILEKLNPDDYIVRTYVDPRSQQFAQLFIGYFKTQRTGKAPHSPRSCLPGAGWTPLSTGVVNVPVGESPDRMTTLEMTRYVVKKDTARMVVLYWYQTARKAIANEYIAQMHAVPELLTHGRTDVALIRIILFAADENASEADRLGASFVQSLYPLVQAHMHSPGQEPRLDAYPQR